MEKEDATVPEESLAPFDAKSSAGSVRGGDVGAAGVSAAESGQTTAVHVQIYDKPMCCPTGVCGPQVDPVLPRFAADLEWLRAQGHQVDRFNLAQQPGEFAKHSAVQQLLAAEGVDCLPLVLVNGRVVSRSAYPSRENLASWTGSARKPETLPVLAPGNSCGGESGCC